ncbi:hypothetical protein NSQ59_27165 [Margalitia sp. FSL K6-0131]|uniref:hypothetical protein n=1 Tax=Margalitia sp. FSL K6-0131 TaxID=2954604 RepID=UPI0030F50F3E
MDINNIVKSILDENVNLDCLEEDLTAEKFYHLKATEKFNLKLKWLKEQQELNLKGEDGLNYFKNKLDKFDLPLKRSMIKVYINNKYFDKFESPETISESFNITPQEVKRLLRKRNKEENQLLSFSKVNEILKGNEYIEVVDFPENQHAFSRKET